VTDAVRTPDDAFAGLPDFPFAPHYREWEGLRLAHIDEGDPGAPAVVLFHGEPTWSFLWRKVVPPLVAAGLRVIAPDLPGFGRSDKPADVGWYSYDRHTAAAGALLEHLDVRDALFVVHDWGGPIGLRLAVEAPERCARMAILDTGLFTGHQPMNDAWLAFRAFVARTEDVPVSLLVRRACATELGDGVARAYDAPYPTPASKAGARAFPLILPTDPSMDGAQAGQRVLDAMRGDRRPKLVLWADGDPVLPLDVGRRFAEAIGAPALEVVSGASHFLQEDAGERIGARIAAWATGATAPAA
jgi:haloalkane dehalogenase